MFCTQCGTKLDEAARFCTACGKPVAHPPVEGFPPEDPRFDRAPSSSETVSGTPPAMDPPPVGAAGATWSASQAQPHRRLRRIRSQKKIAGVCAGFAEYFDMDVTLMRLIWVGLLLIPPHVGLIAYIIAWAVLPKA